VVVVALGMAGAAAWWAGSWAQARMAPVGEARGTPVVVAVLQIPFGKKIEATDVVVKQVPAELVPLGAFTSVDQLDKKVAIGPIYPGEIVIKEKLAGYQSGSPLSAIVAVNKRAVTVRVNDVIGVAGFLLPGNYVDVVASGRDAGSARTILQNMKVLAVDQTASTSKDEPVIVRAVTLEMTPDEAEQLVKATQSGAVQLTLRNPLDTTIAQERKVKALVRTPKPAPPVPEVTVIKGTKVSSAAVGM
jgi:pilus assembly protein CpaB